MAKTTSRITPTKNWPLAKIKPYEHNPRTHPAEQITLLAELLKRWGPDQPIVVDENEIILKGHGRLRAAADAGLKVFPVIQRFGLSEEDKAAMRIADNQVALLSGWDSELVGFEIKRLQRMNFDMKLLGFGEAQLVQFTTQPGPPAGGFQSFGEDIPTEYRCPKCSYSWSGQPNPGAVKTGDEKDSVRVRVPKKDKSDGRSRPTSKVRKRASLAGKSSPGKDKPK